MKRIIKVSIIYMVAALIFAQPVAHGMCLNNLPTIVKETVDSVKPYMSPENCVQAVVLSAFIVFVGYMGYSLWKAKNKQSCLEYDMPNYIDEIDDFEHEIDLQEPADVQDVELSFDYERKTLEEISIFEMVCEGGIIEKDLLEYSGKLKELIENYNAALHASCKARSEQRSDLDEAKKNFEDIRDALLNALCE